MRNETRRAKPLLDASNAWLDNQSISVLNRKRPSVADSEFPSRPASPNWMWKALLHCCFGIFFLCHAGQSAFAAETVTASIEQDAVWTGQPVKVIIKLYSPGPFSGTASFDLPELPQTVILKLGGAVVGSETIDDESWFTQRHEFTLFTQRAGEIVLPAFDVRFAGKKSFTSQPEKMQGKTPELRFQSNRPPGTEQMNFVVAANDLQVIQQWSPSDPQTLTAGDVIERKMTRDASGTTAMMLTPPPLPAIDGVRIYPSDPIVSDTIDRGESNSQRVDVVKYQFQRPGAYQLPDVEFVWWDTNAEKLRVERETGISVNVAAPPSSAETASEATPSPGSRWPLWMLLAGLVGSLGYGLARPVVRRWHDYRTRPDVVARGHLRKACRNNDAAESYAAVLAWKQATRCNAVPGTKSGKTFRDQCDSLASCLFSNPGHETPWSGQALWNAFTDLQAESKRDAPHRVAEPALPTLNPTDRNKTPV